MSSKYDGDDKEAEWEKRKSAYVPSVSVFAAADAPQKSPENEGSIEISEVDSEDSRGSGGAVPLGQESNMFLLDHIQPGLFRSIRDQSTMFKGPKVDMALRISRAITAARDWCEAQPVWNMAAGMEQKDSFNRQREQTVLHRVVTYLFTPRNLNVLRMLHMQSVRHNLYVDTHECPVLPELKEYRRFPGGSPLELNGMDFINEHLRRNGGGHPAVLYFCFLHDFNQTFRKSVRELIALVQLCRAMARYLPSFSVMWNDFGDRKWAEHGKNQRFFTLKTLSQADATWLEKTVGKNLRPQGSRPENGTDWASLVSALLRGDHQWPAETLAEEKKIYGETPSPDILPFIQFRDVYAANTRKAMFAVNFTRIRVPAPVPWLENAFKQDMTIARQSLLRRRVVVQDDGRTVGYTRAFVPVLSSIGAGGPLAGRVADKTVAHEADESVSRVLERGKRVYSLVIKRLRSLGVEREDELFQGIAPTPEQTAVASMICAGPTQAQFTAAVYTGRGLVYMQGDEPLITVNAPLYSAGKLPVTCLLSRELPGTDMTLARELFDGAHIEDDQLEKAYGKVAQKLPQRAGPSVSVFLHVPWMNAGTLSNLRDLLHDDEKKKPANGVYGPSLAGCIRRFLTNRMRENNGQTSGLLMFPVPSRRFEEIFLGHKGRELQFASNKTRVIDVQFADSGRLVMQTAAGGKPTYSSTVTGTLLARILGEGLWRQVATGPENFNGALLQVYLYTFSSRFSMVYIVYRGRKNYNPGWWTGVWQNGGQAMVYTNENRHVTQEEQRKAMESMTDQEKERAASKLVVKLRVEMAPQYRALHSTVDPNRLKGSSWSKPLPLSGLLRGGRRGHGRYSPSPSAPVFAPLRLREAESKGERKTTYASLALKLPKNHSAPRAGLLPLEELRRPSFTARGRGGRGGVRGGRGSARARGGRGRGNWR